MFSILNKTDSRIKIEGCNIFIDSQLANVGRATELQTVIKLTQPVPTINIYENRKVIRTFTIETLNNNPTLDGQFFHSSIRILQNSGVMIDGVISKKESEIPSFTDNNYEGIRFQPFFLSNADERNLLLVGKGLFERGLHFSGKITPNQVRCICICDKCQRSFTIQHFHAGFSEVQYFYSTDCKETLVIRNGTFQEMPLQLHEPINLADLARIESMLPIPSNQSGNFKYYNPFRCPHCLAPFIDFEKHTEIRPNEYYGNTYINCVPRWFEE